MTHQLLAEVMSTALMIIFGVGVHCDDVLKKTKFWILEQVPAEPKIFVSAPVSSGGHPKPRDKRKAVTGFFP